jgi:hypothetical protein
MQRLMKNSRLAPEDIRNFRSECIHARAVFIHFRHLFESKGNAALAAVAPIFFGDVCRALKLYLFVEVCKLTDPAGTAKRNENLSTEFLRASIEDPKLSDQLAPLFGRLQTFRKLAKPARDKLASHSDLATTRKSEAVGAIDNHTWNRFWIDLDSLVYHLSSHYLDEQVHINSASNESEVLELLAALRGTPP